MKLHLLAFGIAKDILRSRHLEYELHSGNTIAALKTSLLQDFEQFHQLASISFAVNENYASEDFVLHEEDEVVLIPPVSGG